MKLIMTLMTALMITIITGCAVTDTAAKVKLSDKELSHLRSKENFEINPELKKRLIEHSKELKLTPEEMMVLKSTGKVILCGKCGYILDSKKYKSAKKAGKIEDKDHSGFADNSLRDRILGPYIN
jgi:hypothetical protein